MADLRPCDRCGSSEETALCLAGFERLCSGCWGDGLHVCGLCEAVFRSCAEDPTLVRLGEA